MRCPDNSCPDTGVWRAWLDREQAGHATQTIGTLDDHLAACAACRQTVGDLWGNAAVATAAFGGLGPFAIPTPAQVERARLRAVRRESAAPRVGLSNPSIERQENVLAMTLAAFPQRWRIAVGGLAAALALTFLVGTSAGQTAAAAFLAQFRGQRLQVVSIDPSQARSPVFELERLGTVQGDRRPTRPEEVPTVAEAGRRAGFEVKQPDPTSLPTGVDKTPKVTVSRASESRITFDRDKARAYFQSIGKPEMTLPDKFHGATLVVGLPATVFLRYAGPTQQDVGLGVVQAGELSAGVEGKVTLDELRDFLLNLPGLPKELTDQLRNMKDWRNTVPIPVPADKVAWRESTIAGYPGFLFTDNSGLGSAAIWQRDGRVYGVVGGFKPDEIRRVADSFARR